MAQASDVFQTLRNHLIAKGFNINLNAEGEIYKLADILVADPANKGNVTRTGALIR